MPETPKQHTAQISHSEPPCPPTVQEVPQVPEETTESPASPSQTLYKLQEEQTEKNLENVKKDQTDKSSEENTTQLPDKTVVQTSKLNPNAKEFVFNPNTKPFIPVSFNFLNKFVLHVRNPIYYLMNFYSIINNYKYENNTFYKFLLITFKYICSDPQVLQIHLDQ